MTVSERVFFVKKAVESACKRAGRDPASVSVVAVSKGHGVEKIAEARRAGLTVFGESYAQELIEKAEKLGSGVAWHFVGHLQSNKVARVLPHVAMVQSVDSFALAERIDRHAGRLGRVVPVLVQVNIGGEPQKHGVPPEEARAFLKSLAYFDHLAVHGLMCIPPQAARAEDARPSFRDMARLWKSLRAAAFPGISLQTLSMGMSSDFRVAIEEGSTMVRIGRLIFGPRQPAP